MFENYETMSAEEKEAVKRAHRALRKGAASREGNLAWAYVRGFPYARVERKTRTQILADGTVVQHNLPSAQLITWLIAREVAGFAEINPLESWWKTKASPEIVAWIAERDSPAKTEAKAAE